MNSQIGSPRSMTLLVATVEAGSLADILCPSCQDGLDLTQPDPIRPDRLLGVCTECGGWHLIEMSDLDPTARIARLPSISRSIAS